MGDLFDLSGRAAEGFRQPVSGGSEAALRVRKRLLRDIGGLHPDGKLMPSARSMRYREERRDGGRKRSGGKAEVAFAVRGVFFHMLHHPGRRTHRIPLNTL